MKGQILGVLRTLKHNPNIHFALADQEFLIRFTLSGETAFLSFDPPGAQEELPFKRDNLLVRAWTDHPDLYISSVMNLTQNGKKLMLNGELIMRRDGKMLSIFL